LKVAMEFFIMLKGIIYLNR